MSMSDPIADMLTRIRNAQSAKKENVSFGRIKKKMAILKVMCDEGYIKSFQSTENEIKPSINVELKYYLGKPVIEMIKRVSRPGLRVYKPASDIPKVMGGLGVVIMSTSKGVMTDRMARKQGYGGEVLCYIS